MRTEYTNILKKTFGEILGKTRTELNFTQAEMAAQLNMKERSYIELDHGKSCCSALTLVLFLIYCCDNPMQFLAELKEKFEKAKQDIA